jgi:hypothetical protein
MPSRLQVLVIVGFWLATSTWLFVRDLLPRLLPGQPPPFTIDLADEAEAHMVRWSVFKDGQLQGYAKTGVDYNEKDDSFRIHGTFKLWNSREMRGQADLVLSSEQFATREGELKGLSADISASMVAVKLEGHMHGEVQDHQFFPHVSVSSPTSLEWGLPSVKLSSGGTVLNPLQPVNRIWGLRKGQTWRVPLVHPLFDAVSAELAAIVNFKTSEPRFVDATVLPKTHMLEWKHEQVPCLVIDYANDEMTARTWVRESDGLVLRQEVEEHGIKLAMQRDS